MLGTRLLLPAILFVSANLPGQTQTERRCILAVGAHAGDMELTCGAVLAKQKQLGDRTVILHLSLGEAGNPALSPKAYGEQKKREALAAAADLGAEVLFGPYQDGLVPNDEAARRYVADVIRRVKPTHVITHWGSSLHKDHEAAHAVVRDAVLLAALDTLVTDQPKHRGVRALYYAENWEDPQGFQPYVCVDVEGQAPAWKRSASRYEFARGIISGFPYIDYYLALMKVRGAESRRSGAVCFDIDPEGKKRVADQLP